VEEAGRWVPSESCRRQQVLLRKKWSAGQGTGQNRLPALMAERLNCPDHLDGNPNGLLARHSIFS